LIYLPREHKRIEELRLNWYDGVLNTQERDEFHSLLDEVVREARRERSAHLLPDQQKPEDYLIELLKSEINRVVEYFVASKLQEEYRHNDNDIMRDRKKRKIEEWMHYAKKIARILILGDATRRSDRRKEVRPHLEKFRGSEERHFTLNSKRAKSQMDSLLGQYGSNKDKTYLNKLKHPAHLKGAEHQLKEFSKDESPSDFMKKAEGPGFVIKDGAAIRAAEQIALKTGVCYDPDYRRKLLKELSWLKYDIKKAEKTRSGKMGEDKRKYDRWFLYEFIPNPPPPMAQHGKRKIESFPE